MTLFMVRSNSLTHKTKLSKLILDIAYDIGFAYPRAGREPSHNDLELPEGRVQCMGSPSPTLYSSLTMDSRLLEKAGAVGPGRPPKPPPPRRGPFTESGGTASGS